MIKIAQLDYKIKSVSYWQLKVLKYADKHINAFDEAANLSVVQVSNDLLRKVRKPFTKPCCNTVFHNWQSNYLLGQVWILMRICCGDNVLNNFRTGLCFPVKAGF